jgi:hypothetical protein
MDKLRTLLAGLRPWVESHAFTIGVTGLAAILVGGILGVVGLTSGGGEVASSTTVPAGILSPTTDAGATGQTSVASTPPGDQTGNGPAWVAVKIDNAPAARPQIGLNAAKVVFEVPVEGGLTRFLALFDPSTAPRVVGPVRSVRPVDVDLARPFTSVMVSTGGRPFVTQLFPAAGIDMATPEATPGFELLERPDPHNLFIHLDQVQAALQPKPASVPGFGTGSFPGGTAASTVTIPYATTVRWEFNDGTYQRVEADAAFTVLDDYEGAVNQYSVETVVVLFAAQRSAGYHDSAGADVPTFDVIGTGKVLVFSGGEVAAGTWLRGAQQDPFRLFADDGTALGLPDGRVYVAVVPRELDVQF